jgi:hypothetical protein
MEAARDLWADQIPPVAAAVMAALVPPQVRPGHVDAALNGAAGLDVAQRATALSVLLPYVEPTVSPKVLEELSGLTDRMTTDQLSDLLGSLANDIDEIPLPGLLMFFQRLLRSTRTRRDLFVSLRDLLPCADAWRIGVSSDCFPNWFAMRPNA